jgi:hypothetical protein
VVLNFITSAPFISSLAPEWILCANPDHEKSPPKRAFSRN